MIDGGGGLIIQRRRPLTSGAKDIEHVVRFTWSFTNIYYNAGSFSGWQQFFVLVFIFENVKNFYRKKETRREIAIAYIAITK